METYATVTETAERWEVSRQMVLYLIKRGRIPGVVTTRGRGRHGTRHLIPSEIDRPARENSPGCKGYQNK